MSSRVASRANVIKDDNQQWLRTEPPRWWPDTRTTTITEEEAYRVIKEKTRKRRLGAETGRDNDEIWSSDEVVRLQSALAGCVVLEGISDYYRLSLRWRRSTMMGKHWGVGAAKASMHFEERVSNGYGSGRCGPRWSQVDGSITPMHWLWETRSVMGMAIGYRKIKNNKKNNYWTVRQH